MLSSVYRGLARAVAPERRYLLLVVVLAIALLVELQFAIRHVYLVPAWELALFDEMIINAQGVAPPASLWSLAWNYTVNGHWLFVPFWFFYADFSWDNANGRIPMLVSWLCLLVVAAMIGRSASPRRTMYGVAVLLVAVAVFSPAAMESMISPLQLVTSLSLLFGVLALRQVAKPATGWAVTVAMLFAFASMASFAYGVTVWPWLLLALLLDRRWLQAAVVLVVGALSMFLFTRIIGPGYALDITTLPGKLASVLAYMLAQAGAGVAYLIHDMRPLVAQLAGAVFVLAHAGLSWALLRSGSWAHGNRRWLWLIAGWLLTTMLLTALGRHYLGPTQGMASRYLVPSTLYPASLLALAWSLAGSRPWQRRAIGVVAGVLLAAVVAGIPTYAERFAAIRNNQRAAVLAERIGVTEIYDGVPNTQLNLWPLPKVYDYLSEHRMSVYAEEWIEWLGSDFEQFSDAALRRCEHGHELRTPYRGGDRLIGWIYSPDTRAAPDYAFFVHEGRMVGMGFMLQERPDLEKHFASPAAGNASYYGYLPTLSGESVNVFGYFADDGSLCAAGTLPAAAAPAA